MSCGHGLLEERERKRTHRPRMKMDEANQWGFLCTNIDKVPRISWFARPVQTRPFDSWGRSESLAAVSNAPLQDSFYAHAENKQKHVSISIFLFQRCTYLIGPSQFADFNLLGGNKTCHQGWNNLKVTDATWCPRSLLEARTWSRRFLRWQNQAPASRKPSVWSVNPSLHDRSKVESGNQSVFAFSLNVPLLLSQQNNWVAIENEGFGERFLRFKCAQAAYVTTSTSRSVPLSGAICGGDGLLRMNLNECKYCIHPSRTKWTFLGPRCLVQRLSFKHLCCCKWRILMLCAFEPTATNTRKLNVGW